ncbi:30732_t:CDS:2, partial [Gigaspora margarita]
QLQDTFYGKFLNNDEIDKLLRQLADLYNEDTIELCRKESLSTYTQIAKFLTQTFYNDDSLEEYEIILLFIRLQVFENELIDANFIYKEKINEIYKDELENQQKQ